MLSDRNHKSNGKILIVDNNLENIRQLSEMLVEREYAVRAVSSGSWALAAAQSTPPHLILLHVKTPEINGFDICRRLKADSHTRDIPVIFMSSPEADYDRLKGFELGGADYITIPFKVEEVLARVETHVTLWRTQQELQQANAELKKRLEELGRSEQALRESETRFRTITEMMTDYAYATRVDEDGTMRLEWETGGIERITGFTPDEINQGEGWRRIIHPDDLPLARQYNQARLRGETNVCEYRIRPKQGEIRWIRDYGCPVWDEAAGRVVRTYGAVQDITRQKQAEMAWLEYEEKRKEKRDEEVAVLSMTGGQADHAPRKTKTILLVEDDSSIRYLAAPGLKSRGLQAIRGEKRRRGAGDRSGARYRDRSAIDRYKAARSQRASPGQAVTSQPATGQSPLRLRLA